MRERLIDAGTELALVAFEEYGDVTAWREVAEANGIDIFAPLPVGRVLRLPDLAPLPGRRPTTGAGGLDLSVVLAAAKQLDWLL